MQTTQHAVTNNEYRNISIAALVESGTNPRKRFDPVALEELAASFKTQGVLAPLLVRELEESKYEVVAGARRLRAARIAELENLPVRIVKLTDAEAIEAQCVENLQRQDIHPLEEALGFRALLELGEPAYTIASIAARTAKSEAYIYGRIRLADLIPPVAEAFLKDQITIGHALLIAKLPAAQQQEAFTAAFRGMWTSDGNTQVLIPVRELAVWIESNILLQLASVPFDKQDETLVPEVGSCANCPKRTGFNKLLFPDVQKEAALTPSAFVTSSTFTYRRRSKTNRSWCRFLRRGIPARALPWGATTMWNSKSRKPRPTEQRRSCRQSRALRKDDRSHRDGRRQARTDRQSLRRPGLPRASPRTRPLPNRFRGNGPTNASASKKPNWQSPLGIALWQQCWSGCQRH